MARIKLTVRLNGTDENPFHVMGLKCNPFSQLSRAEYDGAVMHVQQLGADPVPDAEYIRKHLAGWSPEFVELCCARFKKGEMVEFTVEFDE